MARILITGGQGFIGRHVTEELAGHGHDVLVFDAMIEQVHGSAPPEVPEGARLVQGDIRDGALLRSLLPGMDGVIHLAAEVGVGQSMYEIARYVGANDLGTAVLLEALIDHPVKRVVVASSMSVYGEGRYARPDGTLVAGVRRRPADIRAGRWEPVDEAGDALTALPTDEGKQPDLASIYALTKYVQERAVMIHADAYGSEAVALRLFNVFGAGQALSNPYTGVLANFASRLANGQRPTIFEDGEQKRDFVHVRDVARAFRLAFETAGAAGEVLNIGSGNAYTVTQVATLLAQEMGVPELAPEILGKSRAGDIRNCFADISRARQVLGFDPQHRLEDSLGPFVDWVRGTAAEDRGADMRRQLEQRGLVT